MFAQNFVYFRTLYAVAIKVLLECQTAWIQMKLGRLIWIQVVCIMPLYASVHNAAFSSLLDNLSL